MVRKGAQGGFAAVMAPSPGKWIPDMCRTTGLEGGCVPILQVRARCGHACQDLYEQGA